MSSLYLQANRNRVRENSNQDIGNLKNDNRNLYLCYNTRTVSISLIGIAVIVGIVLGVGISQRKQIDMKQSTSFEQELW